MEGTEHMCYFLISLLWSKSYHLFKWTKWTFLSFIESFGFTHAGIGYLLTIGTEHTCYFLISLYGQGVINKFEMDKMDFLGVYMISMASQMLC